MPRWLNGRFIRWTAAGGVAGIALAVILRNLLSPFRYLPEDRIWVFVSPGCPYSVDIFAQVNAASDVFEDTLLLLPADDSPASLPGSLGMCKATLRQISWANRIQSTFVPETLACRWLVEDAADVYHEISVSWPTWYYQGHVLGDAEFTSLMQSRGFELDDATNTLLRQGEAVPNARQPRPTEQPVGPETVWDDLSEPHAVSW